MGTNDNVKRSTQDSENTSGNIVSCICPCGKEVRRHGQRNGLKCHAKANREYRKRVKAESERIRLIVDRLGASA